ncbi:MAG TPA: glycosyltransferase [Alphaproteobacteria bacterium]|nr:glycosyltransferase [Alphaproteobacteria bacterium]
MSAALTFREPAGAATPAVSVIIPAYNRANCVAGAVESVFAQTFKDLEIIAVDDGSSDGTDEVLTRFGSSIRFIRQGNHGVSSARNTGVRAARGKWIAFLDSDDRWHADKLERQIAVLEKYNGRLCFTRSINHENRILRDIEFISATLCEPEIYYVENAADCVSVSPRHPMIQSAVADRALLEQAGLFDESFPAAEDAELIFRLSFLSGFYYVDSPLATIFENSENSLTYSKNLSSLARRNKSYLRLTAQMYWRLVETSPQKTPAIRERLGYFISRQAELACAAGQPAVARTLARDGILYAGSFRDFARCAGVLVCPGLVGSRARKKYPL